MPAWSFMTWSRNRRLLAAALVAGIGLFPTPGAAGEATAADRVTARQLMLEGRIKRHDGDLQGALASFRAADAIMHVPTTALELARTLAEMERLLEADEVAMRVLRYPVTADEPSPFREARQAAEVLRDQLRRRIPVLRISVAAPGSLALPTVTLDGTPLPVGALDAPWRVDPGTHVVEARSGHGSTRMQAVVREGETRMVVLHVPRGQGTTDSPPHVAEDDSHAAARVWMWGGIGLAIAGTAVGATTGAIALHDRRSLDGTCAGGVCTGADSDRLDRAWTLANVSTGAFVVAGVGAAVGLGAWWLARPHDAPSSVSVSQPGGACATATLCVRGSF